MTDSPSVRALRAIFDRNDAQSGASDARTRDGAEVSEPAGGEDTRRVEKPAGSKQDAAEHAEAEPKEEHKEDTAAAEHPAESPTEPPAEPPSEDQPTDTSAKGELDPPPPYPDAPAPPQRPTAPPAPARKDVARYEACFDAVSVDGVVWPSITCEVWRRSGLPDAYLAQVWDAVAPEQCTGLTRAAFVKGLRLIDVRLQMQTQGSVRRAPPAPPARP